MQKHTISKLLLVGASVMVLSSCLPEDEAILAERDEVNIESQLNLYAQSFQTYASRSLNALTSSAVWAAQTLPEGIIDLSTPAFGSLSMGNAESYIKSAHCKISGDSYHITWFDAKDEDGALSLKGLGNAQSMRASAKARQYIPVENFAVADGRDLNFSDGSTLQLVGGCASLNIPNGSAIAAYKLSIPENVAMNLEKTLLRASDCPEGEHGVVTEKINAVFTQDGSVLIGASQYASEEDALINHVSGWQSVSNSCVTAVAGINRESVAKTANAINAQSLDGVTGDVKLALLNNLQGIDCRQLNDAKVDDEEDPDKIKLYETCENAEGSLDPLDGMDIAEKTLLREEEDVIIAQCPTPPSNNGTVEIDTSNPLYAGLHASLNGKNTTITQGEITGYSSLLKVTRFYEILVDYGDRQERKETQEITMRGTDIACTGTDTLTFTCAQLYPDLIADDTPRTSVSYVPTNLMLSEHSNDQGRLRETARPNRPGRWTLHSFPPGWPACSETGGPDSGGHDDNGVRCNYIWEDRVETTIPSSHENSPLTYSRSKVLHSWKDADKLIPGEYTLGRWRLTNQLSCSLTEVENSGACGTEIRERTGSVTQVGQDIQWGAWTVTGQNAACPPPPTSRGGGSSDGGGGGGEGAYGLDTTGDGLVDTVVNGNEAPFGPNGQPAFGTGPAVVGFSASSSSTGGGGGGGGGGGFWSAVSGFFGGGGSSSGGGGGKVLCTYFYHKGWIDDAIYRADSEYARLYVSENTKNGYHRWAVPMVKWLQEKERPIAEKFIFIWVNAWAHQMAYDMGVIEKRSYIGTFLKSFGEPLCNFIGRFSKETNYMELWKGV